MEHNQFDRAIEKALVHGKNYGKLSATGLYQLEENKARYKELLSGYEGKLMSMDSFSHQGTETASFCNPPPAPEPSKLYLANYPSDLRKLWFTQYANNGEVRLLSNFVYSRNSLGYVINKHLVQGEARELCIEYHKRLQHAESLSQEHYDSLKKNQLSYLRSLSTTKTTKETTMNTQANLHSLVSETPFVTCLVAVGGYGHSMYKIPTDVAKDLDWANYVTKVVVPTIDTTEYALGTIVELHEEDKINYESSNKVNWIVSVVDDKAFSELVEKDNEVVEALKQKRKDIAKENLRNIVLESLGKALPSAETQEKIHD